MWILPVPFDLGGTSVPLSIREDRLIRSAQIPLMNEGVDGTCCEYVRMVRRQIDVGDGARVGV